MRIFVAELTDTDPGATHEDDWLGTDPQAACTLAADLDRAAWHRPNALDTTVRLGFGAVPGPMAALIHLTEVLVHGTDLALATAQTHFIDEEACRELLTIMQGMDFDPFRRPGMFASAVATSDDAPAHRRLMAFLGRDLAHF
ncbi:TIGR03086 family metal-binding protein [Actinomadura citrea]|uniref:TIGR03086 family metal-binding protein n=1 Tax=Actinomadura citrea TaxID=46158 RepID=UPI003CE55C96